MRYYEFAEEKTLKPIKPLSPEDARIKSMQNQLKNTQNAIKSAKAQKKIKAGQQQLSKVSGFN